MLRQSVIFGALLALVSGPAQALTREIAELEPARLTFDRSVLNQLSYGIYREPFDELQTRPFNLLFANIGRHPNLGPWQDQEGRYRRYVNALIGNNGAANVDNDADAVQGAVIRRESISTAWGASAAFLAGNDGSDDTSGASTFSDADDLSGFDLRGAAGIQLSERRVLGVGFRVQQATSEDLSSSFEPGVGGANLEETFDQLDLTLDVGLRQFTSVRTSWEVRAVGGVGSYEQDELSEDLDGTGSVTDRFVAANYEISELRLGVIASHNRLRVEGLGETQYALSLERAERELDNADLSYSQDSGGVTPSVTLVAQDPIETTALNASARTVFQAGHTEMFAGAEAGYTQVEGATTIDASGTPSSETIDDSTARLGLTLGLRQPLVNDKLRLIVSGRADFTSSETSTTFDIGSDGDDATNTTAQYAIGLEGVLANVTFDLAWLAGEEAPVVPVELGVPQGSRRVVEVDRLVVSAAVSW
jgi:hypothetical protein